MQSSHPGNGKLLKGTMSSKTDTDVFKTTFCPSLNSPHFISCACFDFQNMSRTCDIRSKHVKGIRKVLVLAGPQGNKRFLNVCKQTNKRAAFLRLIFLRHQLSKAAAPLESGVKKLKIKNGTSYSNTVTLNSERLTLTSIQTEET